MHEYFLEEGTYTASVLDHTDRNGNLSAADADLLLEHHGTSVLTVLSEGVGYEKRHHAVTLLQHLGY